METRTFFMTSNYYPPHHVGGACIHVYHLANALASLGHEIHVIYSLDWYYFKKGNIEPPMKGYTNEKNVILHPVKSPLNSISPVAAYTLGYYYPLSNSILRTIKDVKPDVIHHHNITGFGPFILKAKADKVIYTAHDNWLVCQTSTLLKYNKTPCIYPKNCSICSIFSKKPPQVWRYGTSKTKLVKNIDTIISPSNYMKDELKRMGISKKIEVIPNFVEIEKSVGPRIFKDPYLLYAGRLEYNKGIIELIESFFEILEKTDHHLVIVGDGSLKNMVDEMACLEKSQGKIHYLGNHNPPTLGNLYKYAAAVVIPSIVPENCPLVALEAISYGTPIMASNSGGLPEIVNSSNAGILFNNRKNGGMGNAITDILKDAQRLQILKRNTKSSENYYTKESYIKKYLDLLNK